MQFVKHAVEENVRCLNDVRTRGIGCQANVVLSERVHLFSVSASVLNTKATDGEENDVEGC